MSKTKEKMNQQIEKILEVLRSFNIPVFEDEVAEDIQEQFKKDGHHFFVYSTGDMIRNDDKKSINQDVVIYYYSEKRDDLDERTVDIITALSKISLFKFERTQKQQLKRKDKDSYVDRVVFAYNRKIISGCAEI